MSTKKQKSQSEKEKQFFSALRNVFVGAKVEGASGFVNLMRIKSRYYEQAIFPRLKEDIDNALKPFPEFREELFDRLYTFFCRYFSESGSIYFRFTPPHEHVYEKIYTDDRDVALFWKTHMLYYVKTDRLFQSMEVELDGFRFFFDVSALEHKRANEKRSLVYDFKEQREDGTLVFTVTYSEKGKKTDFKNIRKSIKDALGLKRYTTEVPSEEVLERAFRLFERQSEVDFFINKNANKFLKEQFNLWLYQYVFEPEGREGTIWTEKRIRQLQALKKIAYKIIDFIAQFEDELVRIWNKPKFVLGSHYIITLDRIAAQEEGMDVLESILAHPGMEAQLREWRELGMVGDDFTPEQVWVTDLMGKRLHERYQYLPLDTKHFPDLEMAIVGLFDHLDQALDGWLVHSENYQALNMMLPKFRDRVKIVYIDPPYNTAKNTFSYIDRFNRAAWISLLENRVRLAKEYLMDSGSIYVHVDFHETASVRFLLDEIFGQENFVNEIIWRIGWVSGFKTQGDKYVRNHETIWVYGKSPKRTFNKEAIAIPYRTFLLEEEEKRELIDKLKRKLSININKLKITIKNDVGHIYKLESSGQERRGLYPVEDVWNSNEYEEINSIMIMSFTKEKVGDFLTQKPEKLLKRVIDASSYRGDLILDFFGGTGTTAAVAHKEKRKWILVEVDQALFYGTTLARMKEVLAGLGNHEPCGISREVNWVGGGFFKYYRLEQYEDVLRKARYRDDDAPLLVQDDPYTQYVFLRDPKMLDNAETGEKAMDVDAEQNEIRVDLSTLYPDIDLAETLSCLEGKWIRRIRPSMDDPTKPGVVEFEDGTKVDLQNPPWEKVKPLIWW